MCGTVKAEPWKQPSQSACHGEQPPCRAKNASKCSSKHVAVVMIAKKAREDPTTVDSVVGRIRERVRCLG